MSDRNRNGATAQPPLLSVRDLHVVSRLGAAERGIVTGIDFDLAAGETLGIVGESGSGKSITARAIAGLLPPGVHARGTIGYDGRDISRVRERELARLRGSEIALIFQDPFTMLNPLMRCGEQITELLRDERGKPLDRRARRTEAERRLAEVGIHDTAVAGAYPFELSGGMRQRVGIAAALAQDPRLLIADEPSTALDVTTQREILGRIKQLQAARGMGLILITHDLRVAFSMCDRIAVLYAGSQLERAPAAALERAAMHPYTHGLLLSEPPVDRRLAELTAIGGSVPDADEVAGCCPFAPRCAWREPACTAAAPPLVPVGDGERLSACIRIEQIAPELEAARAAAADRAATADVVVAGDVAPLVQVRDAHKVFGDSRRGGGRETVALDGVSIELGAGESVGLVGESGSGKTTLGRCLVGLERLDAGSVVIDDVDASDWSRLTNADRRRLRSTVQMVFQDPYSTLNPARSIGATLAEALTLHDGRARNVKGQVGELLERVGLAAAYAERKPVALSGGERQRVAVARALAARPRLLVCDEPVSALDVSVQAQILNLLVRVRAESGVGYLFVTHDLAVVRQVVDRIYVLRRGAVVEAGSATDVLDRPEHEYTRLLIDSVPRADESWHATSPSLDAT